MPEKYQAIMPHGYGWEKTAKEEMAELKAANLRDPRSNITIYDVSKPSEIGEFGINAAIAVDAKNYVTAGDRFWDHIVTSAETYAHAIKHRLPHATVINAGGARTTSMEVRKLVKEAKRRDWKNIATVSVGQHYQRAVLIAEKISGKRSVKKRGINIQVLAAEDILFDPQMHGGGDRGEKIAAGYRRRFEEIQASEPYKDLVKHEKKAIYIEKMHLTRVADLVSRIIRPKVMSK